MNSADRERILARFFAKVNKEHGHAPGACWIWVGSKTGNGYGQISVNDKRVPAHRLAFESWRHPVPPGLELDHLCRRPACVNPDHLEPVTHRENMIRGASPSMDVYRSGRCSMGHEKGPGYQRRCKKCMANKRAALRAVGCAPDGKHGTAHGYRIYGCRCQPCVEAGRAWMKDDYARRVRARSADTTLAQGGAA